MPTGNSPYATRQPAVPMLGYGAIAGAKQNGTPAPRMSNQQAMAGYGYGSPNAQPQTMSYNPNYQPPVQAPRQPIQMTAAPPRAAPQPTMPQQPMPRPAGNTGNLGGDVAYRRPYDDRTGQSPGPVGSPQGNLGQGWGQPSQQPPTTTALTGMLSGDMNYIDPSSNASGYGGWFANNPYANNTPNLNARTGQAIAGPQTSQGDMGFDWANAASAANGPAQNPTPGRPGTYDPGNGGGMSEAQIAARGWGGPQPNSQQSMSAPSGPGGGALSPATAPGTGASQPGMMNINTVNQDTGPIYSDQMITRNRNQQLADMARVTPESAAKQFETPGMSRSAGTWSAALPQMAKFQANARGNIAQNEYGMRNANATNQLDQQYRREMEGFGLANNEFGLQNAYGDLQDQGRQRQINLLMSMLQGARGLNSMGSYGGSGGGY